MPENRKKRLERLSESFGRMKTDPFDFELIGRYFKGKDHKNAFQVLSDKTCNDLDFNELFMFVDRTISKVGQQFLYNRLRTLSPVNQHLNDQEKLVGQLADDKDLRMEVQLHLDNLTKDTAYFISTLFLEEQIKKPRWFFIIPALSFACLLSLLLLPFTPQFVFILLPLIIINMVIHYWNKQNLYGYLGSIPQLLKLNAVAKELVKLGLVDNDISELQESIRTIDRIRYRMAFFKLEAKVQGDIGTAFWAGLELIKAVFLLEPLLFFGVLTQLDSKRREIENVFTFVGYVDSMISVASLRKGLQYYCLPHLAEDKRLFESEDMYHPLIPHCVSNSIGVNNVSVLLTGSNMSGKTSFIRTVGLNAITAMTLNTCFARKLSLSKFKIFSAIRISDNLMNDKSFYFEEVLTIKEMIVNSRMPESNLFLLDEIFKGTNTIERISAGKAVLSFLSGSNNLVFVSTHDIELSELLKDSFRQYHFSEQVNNNTVDFDFKLKEGKLRNRNAIRILEINDYPSEIIKEARVLSAEMDNAVNR